MTAPVLAPLEFYPAPVNPSPQGLYPAVAWQDELEPPRWMSGVRVRPLNYGGEQAFGVWNAQWCSGREPGSGSGSGRKFGVRPPLPDAFEPFTVWAYDECDPSEFSQEEILLRAQQNLRLLEPVAVEMMFAEQMIADMPEPVARPTVRDAVAYLEGQLAKTGTLGQIHASAEAASLEYGIVLPYGPVLRTPLGHQWVFGGGYVDGLGNLLIATSPVIGWRDTPRLYPTFDQNTTLFTAIAERTVIVGYEQIVAACITDVEGS